MDCDSPQGRDRRPLRVRRGITLFDTMITIGIIVIVAAYVVPQMATADQARLMSAAAILRSDLELAQTMSISTPSQPIAVRFDPDNDRYWLAFASTPATPMNRPGTTDPYIVEFGVGEAISAAAVDLQFTGPADDTIHFNSLGGLSAIAASPRISLVSSGRGVELTVSHLTGTITESEIVAEDD